MTKYFNSAARNQFFAVICTILFSSTMLLIATAPAIAATTDGTLSTSVVLPRA